MTSSETRLSVVRNFFSSLAGLELASLSRIALSVRIFLHKLDLSGKPKCIVFVWEYDGHAQIFVGQGFLL
jgi:hypothetical protein